MPAASFLHRFGDDRKAFLEREQTEHRLARVFVALHEHARGGFDIAWRRLAERVLDGTAVFDELADEAIFRAEVQKDGRDGNSGGLGDFANRDLVEGPAQVQVARGVQDAIPRQCLAGSARRHAIRPWANRHIE